jgi:GxxExxY protein
MVSTASAIQSSSKSQLGARCASAGQLSVSPATLDEPLRFDVLVDDCLLVELKAVEVLHPFSKAQLLSYMKLLNIPLGLLINFHEPVLKKGIIRMILPGANREEEPDVVFG